MLNAPTSVNEIYGTAVHTDTMLLGTRITDMNFEEIKYTFIVLLNIYGP